MRPSLRITPLLLAWLCSTALAFAPPHPLPARLIQSRAPIIRMSLSSPQTPVDPLTILNKTELLLLSKEARCVRAIKACKTAPDVQAVLDASAPLLTPNTAAAAMRTMIKFDKHSDTTTNALPLLLEVAGSGVLQYRREKSMSNMTLYALQDVLYSLSLLRKDAMAPLAIIVCDILAHELPQVLDILQPRRLVEILEAAHFLQLPQPQQLFTGIAARLCKSDALGKLQSPKVCEALVTLAPYPATAKVFLRRLRKQAVRRELNAHHVVMAIQAAGHLLTKAKGDIFAEEVEVMAYTFVNRELSRPILQNTTTLVTQLSTNQAVRVLSAISKFGWDGLTVVDDLTDLIDSATATPAEIALTLQSFNKLDIKRPDLVAQLGDRFLECLEDGYLITLQQLNVILISVLRLFKRDSNVQLEPFIDALKSILLSNDPYLIVLRSSTSESDVARYVWFLSQTCNRVPDPEIGNILGDRLLALASKELRPASVVMAVRYAVKMYARQYPDVLRPYLEVVKHSCRTEGSFLPTISSLDLSFLVETLMIAKCTDEKLFVSLAKTARQFSIIEECTPSSARRIMTSFATIVSRVPSESLEGYQHNLFDLLGAHLLSKQLKPYEAAEAVFSYAKAGYVSDMGVFDHVSGLVSENLSELPVRAIAQCLWACGKMYVWEPRDEFMFIANSAPVPPYLQSARKFAKHLATRQNELSAKDLAQILWAVGRLRITDQATIQAFADRTEHVLSDCFAVETSNIIWGLSKAGHHDEKAFVHISRRMLASDIHAAPKEAACVLYSLGNVGIREDEVFEHLSEVMMSQMEDVGAQAMANALWAHNVVGKLPPSKLMQSWAADKLGLVGVQPFDPEFEMY